MPRFYPEGVWKEMRDSMRLLLKFFRNETGVTAIEYSLIAAGTLWRSSASWTAWEPSTKFTSLNNSLK
jgi:hypothetical protein